MTNTQQLQSLDKLKIIINKHNIVLDSDIQQFIFDLESKLKNEKSNDATETCEG